MKNKHQDNFYTLDLDKLQKGDIILSNSKDRISKTIQIVTLGKYSHARLYLGESSYAEAAGPGIRITASNPQRLFFQSEKECKVLRLKEEPDEEIIDEVINGARRLIGTEYSLSEAKLVALRRKHSAKEVNRQFCSRYVAQAYENAGIEIVDSTDYCSPNDIGRSSKLREVEDCLRVSSAQEVEKFNKESPELRKSDEALNYIFTRASEISEMDIQTFEQFNSVLLIKPDLDEDFSRILLESGYLGLWKLETTEEPWSFNRKLLEEKIGNPNQLLGLSIIKLGQTNEFLKRIDPTLELLKKTREKFSLKSLDLQIELFKTLKDLCETKLKVYAIK